MSEAKGEANPGTGELGSSGFAPTVWITAIFAPRWYADAARESGVDGYDARRREIVFAVCCAESYLVEWIRDKVLSHQFDKLVEVFPADESHVGISGRWEATMKKLVEQNRVPRPQEFKSEIWQEFTQLVEYRDGLVHGRSSWRAPSAQSDSLAPVPAGPELEALAPGWATTVVHDLIHDLHRTVGTPPPSWAVPP